MNMYQLGRQASLDAIQKRAGLESLVTKTLPMFRQIATSAHAVPAARNVVREASKPMWMRLLRRLAWPTAAGAAGTAYGLGRQALHSRSPADRIVDSPDAPGVVRGGVESLQEWVRAARS